MSLASFGRDPVMSEELVSDLLARIDRLEQCATAAGHGFGHLPLTNELNGGWTQLDLTDNVRPTYDQTFARTFDPDHVLRLCRAHRDIIDIWKYSGHAREKFDTPATVERLLTMNEIVEALARGLGVEEPTS